MLIKDFPANVSTIPFNPVQQSVMWVSFAIFVISSLADILIITAMVKQRDIPIDTKFIISMTAADFLFSTMEIVIDIINGLNGGWSLGKIGCYINALLIIYTLGCSLLSLLGMCLTRYLTLMRHVQFRQRDVHLIIAGIWVGLAMTVGLFYFIMKWEQSHSLRPAYTYCFIAMDQHSAFTATLLLLLAIVGIMMFQIYAWTKIVLYYVRMKAKQRQEPVSSDLASSTAPSSVKKKAKSVVVANLSELEVRLVKKAIWISLTFILSWIWFVGMMMYEMASQQEVPLWYDVIWEIVGSLTPILNAIILYTYDAKVRVNLREMLRLDELDAIFVHMFSRRAGPLPPSIKTQNQNQVNLKVITLATVKDTETVKISKSVPLESSVASNSIPK